MLRQVTGPSRWPTSGGVPGDRRSSELRSGVAERRTIEHQEEILEKMLEAQRSLYTRDQEREERQAERPTTWTPPPSPPPLSPSLLRAPSVNMRSRSAQSELPRGYEDLVREYFRALGEGRPWRQRRADAAAGAVRRITPRHTAHRCRGVEQAAPGR